jgi:hypothetical protein
MTVLTPEETQRLLAGLPDPDQCDGCGNAFSVVPRIPVPHGPFTLHLCPVCVGRLQVRRLPLAGELASIPDR